MLGSSSEPWHDERWRTLMADTFTAAGARGAAVDAAVSGARYLQADVTDEQDLRRLLAACTGDVILYFALPPEVTRRRPTARQDYVAARNAAGDGEAVRDERCDG